MLWVCRTPNRPRTSLLFVDAACNRICPNWGVFLLDEVPRLATKHPESMWLAWFELGKRAWNVAGPLDTDRIIATNM